jgi:formylglycine-generating enzyme required for sulfatase activity
MALAALLCAATVASAQTLQSNDAGPSTGEKRDWRESLRLFRGPVDAWPTPWPAKQFDPKPAGDQESAFELHLPMPCAGTMVFRRIDVGDGQGLLGEREMELGSASGADAPSDERHRAYLAGAFGGAQEGGDGRRHYFMGKYEVTELQYEVMHGPCPGKLKGRRPAIGISWYDAVDFTRRYTEWLHDNARDQLPQADGVRGYLRLPTEVEWEYAARGGLEVDEGAFRKTLFPMTQGSIESYAWIRESVASNFKPRPIGSLLPNPLGLHDVLGNAAELVLDPYRLNVHGRLHGQPGGFVAKGGHFRSWRKRLGTSWRREYPHFNPRTGRANRLDTVGFRVAISAPVLTSERQIERLHAQYAAMPAPTKAPLAAEAPATDNQCQVFAGDIRDSLSILQANLQRCLVMTGTLSLPPFPQPLPLHAETPAPLPAWDQIRKALPNLTAAEIRRYGLDYLNAKQPDRTLVLFKQATRKGDGWSALAIGAMYDPTLFESPNFEPQQTPFSKPNPDMAACWYQLSQALGEQRATLRLDLLTARQRVSEGDPQKVTEATTTVGCEQILLQYGAK